jgi:hypothetical protein
LIAIGQASAPYLWEPGSWIGFALNVGSYLGSYAVPYIATFLLAIFLLPELRRVLIPWEAEPAVELSMSGAAKAQASRPGSRKR